MPVSPADVNRVAQTLYDGKALAKADEATSRTVIGRAYYSAYLSTRDALRQAYADLTFDVSHESLIRFMVDSPLTLRTAGTQLNIICQHRVRADYKTDQLVERGDAEWVLDQARDLINQAADLQREFKAQLPRKPDRWDRPY